MHHIICVAICYTHYAAVSSDIRFVILCCEKLYTSQCLCCHLLYTLCCVAICFMRYTLVCNLCYTQTIFCVSICRFYTLCCVITLFVRLILLCHCLLYGSPLCCLLLPSDTRITLSCVSVFYMHHSVLSYYL